MKTLILGVAAALLFAGPALADSDFGTWDTNQDGRLDQSEFSAGVGTTGGYKKWDTNGDGRIQQEEFGGNYNGDSNDYTAWDTNSGLDDDELNAGMYSSMDKDGDGFLNDSESSEYLKGRDGAGGNN